MTNKMIVVDTIRNLLAAQTHDIAWLFEASKHLGVDVLYLNRDGWDKTFWHADWGELERVPVEGSEIPALAWHRPDGGASIALIEHPEHVRAVQFGLLAELGKALQNVGQLSYAKVGFPADWAKCRIVLNGKIVDYVMEADALVGTVKLAKKDAHGKLQTTADKQDIDYQTVKGRVEIIINEKSLGFF